MPKPLLFALLLLTVAAADDSNDDSNIAALSPFSWPVDYGEYCGLYVTSEVGVKPLDDLDLACLHHDFCVSAVGYTNCFCSEQLYYTVMNLEPGNATRAAARNAILKYIYYALSPCSNYDHLNDSFWLSSSNVSGYNFFPLFSDFLPLAPTLYTRGNQAFIDWIPGFDAVAMAVAGTHLETWWLNPEQYSNATLWLLTADAHNPNSTTRTHFRELSAENRIGGMGETDDDEFVVLVVNFGTQPVQITVKFWYTPTLNGGMIMIFAVLGMLIMSLVGGILFMTFRKVRIGDSYNTI